MDIKKKAEDLVRKHQTRNPFEIIRGLNVILVFTTLVGVRGFYQYFQRNNIIYIAEDLPEHESFLYAPMNLATCFFTKRPTPSSWIPEPISIPTSMKWRRIPSPCIS